MTVQVEARRTDVITDGAFHGSGTTLIVAFVRVFQIEEAVDLTPVKTGTTFNFQEGKIVLVRTVFSFVRPVQTVNADIGKTVQIFSTRSSRKTCCHNGCSESGFTHKAHIITRYIGLA